MVSRSSIFGRLNYQYGDGPAGQDIDDRRTNDAVSSAGVTEVFRFSRARLFEERAGVEEIFNLHRYTLEDSASVWENAFSLSRPGRYDSPDENAVVWQLFPPRIEEPPATPLSIPEYVRRITVSGNTLSWDSEGGADGSFTPAGGGDVDWDDIPAPPNRQQDDGGRAVRYIPAYSRSPSPFVHLLPGAWGFLDANDLGGGGADGNDYANALDVSVDSSGKLSVTIGRTGSLADLSDSVQLPDNDNYSDSVDLAVAGQKLSITIGRSGILADLTDSVDLPGGSEDENDYANSVALAVNGSTLSITIGRTGDLANLTDNVVLPTGGAKTFFGLDDTPDSGMIRRTTPGQVLATHTFTVSSSTVNINGINFRVLTPTRALPVDTILARGRSVTRVLMNPLNYGLFYQINGSAEPIPDTVVRTGIQINVTNNANGNSYTNRTLGSAIFNNIAYVTVNRSGSWTASVGNSITVTFSTVGTTTTVPASGYFFAVDQTGLKLLLTPPPSGITDEHIQDVVGGMLDPGTGIQIVYNDFTGKVVISNTGGGSGGGGPTEYIRRLTVSGNTLSWDSIGGIDGSFTPSGGSAANNYADSVDLAVNGQTLSITIGRNGTLADLTDSVTLPSGGGGSADGNDYADSVDLAINGQTLSITIGRSGVLGDLTDSITLPGGAGGLFSPVLVGSGGGTIDAGEWSPLSIAVPSNALSKWLMVGIGLSRFSTSLGSTNEYALVSNERLNAGNIVSIDLGGAGGTTDSRISVLMRRGANGRFEVRQSWQNDASIGYSIYRIESSIQSPVGPDGVTDLFVWNNSERELTIRTTSGFMETVEIPAGSGGSGDNNYANSVDLAVNGTTLSITIGRNGTLSDLTDSVTLPTGSGADGNNYADSLDVNVSGSTLTITIGRSGTLADLVDSATLPTSGQGVSDGVSTSVDLAVNGSTLSITIGRSGTLADLTDSVELPTGAGGGVSRISALTGLDVTPTAGTGAVSIGLDLSELPNKSPVAATDRVILDSDQKALVSDILGLTEVTLSDLDELPIGQKQSAGRGSLTTSQLTAITGDENVLVEVADNDWRKVSIYQFVTAALRTLVGDDTSLPSVGSQIEWTRVSGTTYRAFWNTP